MRQSATPPFADAKKRRVAPGGGGSHFDPTQPRGGDGRWIAVGARIDRARGLAGQNVAHHERIAPVRQPAAASKLLGQDVRGFHHAVSNQALAHAKRKHPDLTDEDFRRIPQVIRTGAISRGEDARNGSPRIRFRAEVDGVRYGYVAEVRRKQRRLDMVTFYRRG